MDKVVTKYSINKPAEREIMLRFIVDRLSSGERYSAVISELMDKFKLNQTNATTLVNDSKDSIKNQMQIRVPFILSIHIERYEYLYKKFNLIGRTDLMNKCMAQKEELLNLRNALAERLSEDFVRQELENKFNVNKLSKEQQLRVRQLIEKGLVDA